MQLWALTKHSDIFGHGSEMVVSSHCETGPETAIVKVLLYVHTYSKFNTNTAKYPSLYNLTCDRLITDLAGDGHKNFGSTALRDCHCPALISDIHLEKIPLRQQPEGPFQQNAVIMSSACPLGYSVRNIVSSIRKYQCADAAFLFLS